MRKVLLLAFALGGVVSAQAQIVYDNTTNVLGFLIGAGEDEWGDAMTLAGTERNVTGFDAMIHSNSGAFTADLTARLYAGGSGGVDPGALLWSATVTGAAIAGGLGTYSFVVPGVLVPNDVTWTVQMTNRSNSTAVAGPRFVSPPTVGSSEDYVWDHVGGVWTDTAFGVGANNNNFGARLTAVPEPASLTALALGGLALLRRRRK